MITLKVKNPDRLDKYLSNNSNLSRKEVNELIKAHAVLVNDMIIRKPSFMLREDQEIKVTKILDKMEHLKAQDLPLEIVFENSNYLIVNKAKGMVTHPAPGHPDGTLVNALMFHVKQLSNTNGLLRPGIIHRLDKDTSGLLVVAKTNEAHLSLSNLLRKHEIQRTYLAVIEGHLENHQYTLNLPLGRSTFDRKKIVVTNINSKEAITKVKLLKHFHYQGKALSLVECQLETGRTHQIRVHLAHIKYPVYNDPFYGTMIDSDGQYLQAYKLDFIDPFTQEKRHFELPYHSSIQRLLDSSEKTTNFN